MKLSLQNGESYTRNDVNGNEYCDCLNEASLQFESHKMTCWKAPVQFDNVRIVRQCARHCARLFLFVRGSIIPRGAATANLGALYLDT